MKLPENLLYTKDHEWALKKDGTITVGITDFAQHQLGDIVYLELPAVGSEVKQGNQFGVVESVKAVSELYSPISGKVVKVNEDLKNTPEVLNKDPYDQGWMIQVEYSNDHELTQLLSKTKYETLIS